jgi:hypothetical protein
MRGENLHAGTLRYIWAKQDGSAILAIDEVRRDALTTAAEIFAVSSSGR